MKLRGFILDFLDDVKKIFKDIMLDDLSYKICLMGTKGMLILGVKDLIEFSTTQIVMNLKNQKVFLKGINFLIKSFKKNEIFIEGKVLNLEIL